MLRVRLPWDTWERLEKLRRARRATTSDLVRRFILEGIEREVKRG